jgi:ferrochelatase
MAARTGLLLVNLGTPDAPTTDAVRRYLAEFLSDPRVIDMPAPLRFLLLHGIILRTRPSKSAKLYQSVWTDEGSPLLVAGRRLEQKVRAILDDEAHRNQSPPVHLELAMRYGNPGLKDALLRFEKAGVDRIVLFPLYPQYAAATTGSTVARVLELVQEKWVHPSIHVVPPFYDDPLYLDVVAGVAREALGDFKPDHVLFSFHGIPATHVKKGDPTGQHCLVKPDCCAAIGPENRLCYRAHCVATARSLVERLGYDPKTTTTTFQSRLGRAEWLRPYTDETIAALAKQGTKKLAVFSPAFVADCLETIEELGHEAKKTFTDNGGVEYRLVPCVNDDDRFARAVVELARRSGFFRPQLLLPPASSGVAHAA